MVEIKRQIVPEDIAKKVTFGNANKKRTVTIHQTGNTNKGANAQAHAKLQSKGNTRDASWHYSVDDEEIIQSFEDSAQCWHATDGRGPGNLHSIAIELCINSDAFYKKTLENGAKLVAHLLDKYELTVKDVKQHNDWYPKNCPAQLRAGKDGITWNDFLAMVESEVKASESAPVKPNPSPVKKPSKTPDMKTTSIVDYLVSIGEDSSFANRKKLAVENGIKSYSGTASQNTQLLKILRGKGSSTVPPKKESKPKKETVRLPKSSSSWRVYPTNKAPVKGNEKGYLNPKKFGGLQYEVLAKPQAHVVTIQTKDFGKVNIYVHPSTGAVLK